MASSTYSLPVSRPRWEGSSAERAIQPRKWYSSPWSISSWPRPAISYRIISRTQWSSRSGAAQR